MIKKIPAEQVQEVIISVLIVMKNSCVVSTAMNSLA